MWKVLLSKAKRFPWISNVAFYSCIFAAGDLAQQKLLRKEKVDFKQTRNVAVLALVFHGNVIYLWVKVMETVFPGATAGMILRKMVCDQLVVTPIGISAFYIGMSAMEGKQDIFAVWKEKFWKTYKAAVIYWPMVQITSYSLVPVFFRMACFGCCGFVWIIFISHLRQHGDGTAGYKSELFNIEENPQTKKR